MSGQEGRRLTPTDISSHLACNHLTQLNRQLKAGTLRVNLPPDPRLEALIVRGLQHEARYVTRLVELGHSITRLDDTRDPAKTLAAMQTGAQVIVQAPLGNSTYFGIADLLLRVDTPCPALGDYSYVPADTKLAESTKAGTILQLCTYTLMLEEMQGLRPEHFFVITQQQKLQYQTDQFGAYFRLVQTQLLATRTADPAPTTYPEPCEHCDVCRFWQHCQKQRLADDHLSVVAGMHATHRRECERQGIKTMTALAQAEGRLPETPERGSAATYLRLGQQARLQVAARSMELPPVERLEIQELRGFRRLPEPCIGDVFLDFEGDPFVGEHGREYLTGWTSRESGAPVYEKRWGLQEYQEKRALKGFLDWVVAARERHPGMHIYHFGAYEPSALKRLCSRHDVGSEVLDELLRGGRLIDLHHVVREALRIGIDRYGLKQLEALHGYVRKFDLREASVVCRDLELALELDRSEVITDTLCARVADYNREDCESTASLRDWLEAQRQAAIEDGCDIPRPELLSGEPGDKARERDTRITTLKAQLHAMLPEDEDEQDLEGDDKAVALLASMLGYFHQEEKTAHWERFRLRELAAEEHLDEREMLAELQFVAEQPKTKGQRNARRVFRFPRQETSLQPGDTAIYTAFDDPNEDRTFTTTTVEELDLSAGTVTLSMNAAAAATPPTSVFRDPLVGAQTLEDSLHAFAKHVRDHGFEQPEAYATTSDLLRRLPPRRGDATGQDVRRADEATLDTAKRVCLELTNGVLPIQGPPGSGKTFTGARAIVALALAGKRVGITAVSHKVIDNLLLSVADAAGEAGVELRLLHKDKGTPPDGIEYSKKGPDVLAAIAPATVVGGTAWLWSHNDALGKLDYLFVDEAGQMSLAQTLAASRAAKNLVLLGDPQQLEQPSRGAHPDGADVAALAHVVGSVRTTIAEDQGLFLDKTWRLAPDICSFTSKVYYEGRLRCIDGCERQRIDGTGLLDGAGMFLHECEHRGNQASAPEEVDAVLRIAKQLLCDSATWTDRTGDVHRLTADDILVIAPYNAQVSALKRAMGAIGVTHIGTVDKFQGQEAAVVLYSCTSSSPLDAPRGMSFLYDPHRLNVASSRAKCVFVMVAAPALFTPEVKTPEQMRWANGMCLFREVARRI